MKENTNVQEVMEQETVNEETEVTVNEEKEGKLAKAGKFIKKHGKKIAIGAGVALAGAAVFVVRTLMNAKAGDEDVELDFIEDSGSEDESVIIDIPAEDVEIGE